MGQFKTRFEFEIKLLNIYFKIILIYLGIIHLKKGDCNEAIRLFYNVIRNDPDDSNMWGK